MNVLKKQLRIPSSFSGMKKAVSTSDLSDRKCSEMATHHNSLNMDTRFIRSKSPSINTQEFTDLLNTLYNTMTESPSDELPKSLSTEWLTMKYSAENDNLSQKKNSAILELLTTELNYLNQMQFLLDISQKIFANVQQRYFSYINAEDVFLNFGDIYEVNYQFWTTYLYPSFKAAKENDDYISCRKWKNGFKEISTIFIPYQTYCSWMIHCQKKIQSLEKDKYFSQFVQWFSRTDQSNRESLTDFIAKPFQRLTKYKLLLTNISGYSDNDDEIRDLAEMINSIHLFVKQVEWKLPMGQICDRIEPLDFVEPPIENLADLCAPYRHLDLTMSINASQGEVMRRLIKEGTFKMKVAQTKIMEVSLLLFTDLILICQKIKNFEEDRIKVIRPIIPLIKVEIVKRTSGNLVLLVLDDFGCLASMYLLIHDPGPINEWINAVHNAQFFIKNISQHKSSNENKVRVNIITPSPIAGRSPTPTGSSFPSLSLSPQHEHPARVIPNGRDSFSRSNFRSSPIIRKRPQPNGSAKGRTESLGETSSSDYEPITINRSMSQQHHLKSHMSITEDEDEDVLSHLGTIESSTSSIEPESPRQLSLVRESIENGDIPFDQMCDITFTFDDKKTDRLTMMRPYGSMMDLQMDS